MSSKRVWIMDGHNMIFAIPGLQRLQVTGRGEEARGHLSSRLERFAMARGERVLLVFDGKRPGMSGEVVRGPFFEAVYAQKGEGAADERILREVRARSARGMMVTVVTNDVTTLASRLPPGAGHVGVAEFWLKHVEKPAARDEGEADKRVTGDFSDIEDEMLRQAAMAPVAPPRASVLTPAGPGRRARGGISGEARTASPRQAASQRLAVKRERGRLRQERLLKRRKAKAPKGPRVP